jgi:hypothetical protein
MQQAKCHSEAIILMKILVFLAMATFVVLGVIGCGGKESNKNSVTANQPSPMLSETEEQLIPEQTPEPTEQKTNEATSAIPSEQDVIDRIQKASSLYYIFDMESLAVNQNCLSKLSNPDYQYYCEVDEDGSNIHSYEDLLSKLEEVYSPESAVGILLQQVGEYPDHSKTYMRYENNLYALMSGRGSSWGYENFWGKATARLVRQKDKDHLEYLFVLPNGQEEERMVEKENGDSEYELYYSDFGQTELDVELVKVGQEWKLVTVIDTLGM